MVVHASVSGNWASANKPSSSVLNAYRQLSLGFAYLVDGIHLDLRVRKLLLK